MVIIDKLKDLDYNEVIALAVIDKDSDLKEIFTDEVKTSFNLVISLSKENKLNEDTKSFIRKLFDKVILSKPILIDWYLRLMNESTQTDETTEVVESVSIVEPEPTKIPSPVAKPKKEKALPRRYGKDSILKDIEKQGGKATNAQLTALAVNDLKNMYVNLSSRLVNDMLTENKKLTDEECREIRATIKILENKLRPILKKK
jgi:hypothetical protein